MTAPTPERRLRILAALLVPVVVVTLAVSLVVGLALLLVVRVLALVFRAVDWARARQAGDSSARRRSMTSWRSIASAPTGSRVEAVAPR
jgi:hypothetical protein